MIEYTDAEIEAASEAVTRTITNLAMAAPGDTDDKFLTEPAFDGSSFRTTRPTPLATLRAARLLRSKVSGELRDAAHKARGIGTSWKEIGDLLGLADPHDEYDDPAANAFYEIAGPPAQRYDPTVVTWRCATCKQYVKDNGPFDSSPANTEQGHSNACGRHLDELAAHQRRLDGLS